MIKPIIIEMKANRKLKMRFPYINEIRSGINGMATIKFNIKAARDVFTFIEMQIPEVAMIVAYNGTIIRWSIHHLRLNK